MWCVLDKNPQPFPGVLRNSKTQKHVHTSPGTTRRMFLILLAQLPVVAFLQDGTLRKVFGIDASVRHPECASEVSLFPLCNSTWILVELRALRKHITCGNGCSVDLKEKWRGKTSSILKSKDNSISGNYLVIRKELVAANVLLSCQKSCLLGNCFLFTGN